MRNKKVMAAREISGVRAKKIPQMREWRCAAQPNKNASVFIRRQGSVSGAQLINVSGAQLINVSGAQQKRPFFFRGEAEVADAAEG